MKNKYDEELKPIISKPLKKSDALFQIKYFIQKTEYDKALHIVNLYEMNHKDLQSILEEDEIRLINISA